VIEASKGQHHGCAAFRHLGDGHREAFQGHHPGPQTCARG
jgi:hypothetical protein